MAITKQKSRFALANNVVTNGNRRSLTITKMCPKCKCLHWNAPLEIQLVEEALENRERKK